MSEAETKNAIANLDAVSQQRLIGVHGDLVKVVLRAAVICGDENPFRITEGLRDIKRQRKLVASGKSQTLKSRHLTGHAVDIVPMLDGEPSFDWPGFYPIADAFKAAAKELGVAIIWGGDWRTFKDGPHFELDRKRYP